MKSSHNLSWKFKCALYKLIITHWTNKAPSITKSLNRLIEVILSYNLSMINSLLLCLVVCRFDSLIQRVCFPSNIPGKESAFPVLHSVPLSANSSSSAVVLKLEQHSGIYNCSKQSITGKESHDGSALKYTFCKVSYTHFITLLLHTQ